MNAPLARRMSRSGEEALIYLDVDGVLNTTCQRAARQHLDNELIANLRHILDAVPEAAIVVSSSWRLGPPLMEALESRLAAEGIDSRAIVAVTGQVPLNERDHTTRGDGNSIDAELARLAVQRAAEIQASVSVRRPQAWIAIDDLDLRPPNQSTLCMGYPTRQPQKADANMLKGHQGSMDENGRGLPPLAPRRPFTLGERRAMLPQHPLSSQLPRRRSRDAARTRLTTKWIAPQHFVHTSEATGLTCECAEVAIEQLRAQLSQGKVLPRKETGILSSQALS